MSWATSVRIDVGRNLMNVFGRLMTTVEVYEAAGSSTSYRSKAQSVVRSDRPQKISAVGVTNSFQHSEIFHKCCEITDFKIIGMKRFFEPIFVGIFLEFDFRQGMGYR